MPDYTKLCEVKEKIRGVKTLKIKEKTLCKEFKDMIKILFVCHGNICRSPMAEFVMKDLARRAGVSERLYIASAATSTEEIGNPVHYGTKNKLKKCGISTDGKRAVRMKREDYAGYDYLIGMDEWNLSNMKRIAGGDPDRKIYSLLDFTEHPREIADPWYTGDFDSTYNDILEGCTALLHALEEKGVL